ncbi:MAG: endonuclease/exonuclease/phosphatase family protein [Pseudomonadota bacterium]
MKRLLCAAAALSLCGTAFAQKFSIGTFNTYWAFDDEAPHLNWRDRRADETYQETLTELAGTILEIDADILALQEVENEKVVNDLADLLRQQGLDYAHVFVGEGLDPFTGQNVAILSKFPAIIKPVLRYPYALEDYQDDRTGAPRIAALPKLMRVDFDVEGKIVTVFAAHLKSQRGGETAEEERLAQTRMVRRMARAVAEKGDSRSPSYVAIVGDLNDDVGTPTLRSLRGLHDGSYDFQQTTRSIDEAERYTHIYCPWSQRLEDGSCPPEAEEREQLDHVLASYFLDQSVTSAEIIRVDNDVSDHDAVKVTFDLTRDEG